MQLLGVRSQSGSWVAHMFYSLLYTHSRQSEHCDHMNCHRLIVGLHFSGLCRRGPHPMKVWLLLISYQFTDRQMTHVTCDGDSSGARVFRLAQEPTKR